MRSVHAFFVCSTLAVLGSVAPSLAADSGQAAIVKAYAVYFREGFRPKNVASFAPYFDPGLYALAVRWSKTPPLTGKKSYACYFDSDPFANAQNGRAVPPLKFASATASGGATLYPVAITLQFTKGTLDSHVIVAVVGSSGQQRVSDIIPVINGKSDPSSSLRAQLTRFSKDPDCR